MIEKSYTEEEIAEVVRKHGLPRYPKLALYREKLSRKAKAEPNFRFYCLYGQLLRMDVLRCAYEQVRANKGAPGVDRITFGDIERDKDGVDGFLTSIQQELKAKTYRASPVKRVYIEKANGKLRPLGIPTIKDRTIQAAVKLVIEPIFEADFHDCSFGFRPNRNAQQAVERIAKSVKRGKTEVYDADLTRYYDTLGRNTGYAINGTRQTIIGYDTCGRISTMQVPAAEERMNLHSTTTTPNYNSFHWNYLPGSDLKASLQYPNGLTASWQYDANNQLLQVCNATPTNIISQFDYTYDAAGRRIAMTKSGSAMSRNDTIDYAYNSRSELTNALARADVDYNYAYAYDDIGNRISSTERGTNTVYAANELNQYTAVDDFTPEFDDDGNQTLVKTATGIWRVTYNGENRSVCWVRESDNQTLVMTYDYKGRRREKNLERFFYYGYLLAGSICPLLPSHDVNCYIWDPSELVATHPLVWTHRASAACYVHDGDKNVSEIVSVGGPLGAHYEYAPFGEMRLQVCGSAGANSLRFASEYQDNENGVIYYNFRHYQPFVGRWECRDHILYGLPNDYNFISNKVTLNRIDVLGLVECKVGGGTAIHNQIVHEMPENGTFDGVVADVAPNFATAESGQDILDNMSALTGHNCCIASYTIAGHGWGAGGPRLGGNGIPGAYGGNNNGNQGLYVDDFNFGDEQGLSRERGGRTLSDLSSYISQGKIKFCKDCKIQIFACRMGSSFSRQLSEITGCTVTAASGACRIKDGKWYSDVGEYSERQSPGGYFGFYQIKANPGSDPIINFPGNYYDPK